MALNPWNSGSLEQLTLKGLNGSRRTETGMRQQTTANSMLFHMYLELAVHISFSSSLLQVFVVPLWPPRVGSGAVRIGPTPFPDRR